MVLGLALGLDYFGGGGGQSFTPADIPDLTLWLDASDAATITASAGAVSQWSDKSGNSYNATQGTAANRPLTGSATLNGRNVLTFDGTNDALILPSGLYTISTGANTVFVVAKSTVVADAAAARRILSGKTGTSTNYGIIPEPQINRTSVRNGGSNSTAYTKDNDAHIWGMRRSGTSLLSYYNGYLGPATNGSNTTLTELTLGHDVAATASQAFQGDIAEVLIWNRALTAEEINQVGDYLASKWGVTWASIEWSPVFISDLRLLLDPTNTSSISQSGGSVSQLNDLSGNAYNATQGTGAKQPMTGIDTINGLNVLTFDGVDDTLSIDSAFDTGLTATNTTQFHVSSLISLPATVWAIGGTGTSTRFGFEYTSGLSQIRIYSGNSTAAIINSTYSLDQTYIVAGHRSGNTITGYVDGSALTGSATNANGGSITNVFVGSLNDSGNFMDGLYGGSAVYTRALTNAEMNEVGQYYANKLGGTWVDL